MPHKIGSRLWAAIRSQLVDKAQQARILLLLCLLGTAVQLTHAAVHAESPPPIVTNIDWDEDPTSAGNQRTFVSVAAIAAAYNNAHRQEEIQLGLANGTLGSLQLPTDVQWSQLSLSQKALILINAERRARVNSAQNITGIPLSGVDYRLTALAQQYADRLLQTNTSGHLEDGSPFDRLNTIFGDPATMPTTTCREFLPYAEALASFWRSGDGSFPAIIEQAVYNWLYRDSSSNWGHRDTLLMQDTQRTDQGPGYHNNLGSLQHEGLLAVGHAAGPNSDPLGWGWPRWGEVVVLNLIDQSVNPNCAGADRDARFTLRKAVTTPPGQAAGEIVTMTLTLHNSGGTLLTGINLTDTIQTAALTYLAANITPTLVDQATGKVVWRDLERSERDGTLDPTETVTLIVRLTTTGAPIAPNVQPLQASAESGWHLRIRASEQRSLQWHFFLPVIIR